MVRRERRFKRSAGTVYGPMGALRVIIAPWRRSAISSDINAIDQGDGRKILCWFRGLYGDYPHNFRQYFMDLSLDGMILRKYVLFTERQRILIADELLSARERRPLDFAEVWKLGTDLNAIIVCTTPLGILEFALKRTDVPLLLHYIDRLREKRQGNPAAPIS